MIDMHVHILPGVDDGPETLQGALSLATALVQEGVHTAIATPHYNEEYPHKSAREIHARVYELQQALDSHNIPLKLFAGHEVLIKPGIVGDIQAGRIATLNRGHYLLLELWSSSWLPETERVIFDLRTHGIVPIIAHPERYKTIQQDHERLAGLIRQGALAQVTASSLVGIQGQSARRCAEYLLKKGLIHFIASDAHGFHLRPPSVQVGLQRAEKLLGRDHVHQLTELHPAVIIRNQQWGTALVEQSQLIRKDSL